MAGKKGMNLGNKNALGHKSAKYWLGRKMSKGHKERIGEGVKKNLPRTAIKKGQHLGIKTEFKKGDKRLIRENNTNWKGGVTAENELLRRSPEWRQWRKAVFERDNYTCQDCGNSKCGLHPHHIKMKSIYPELIFDIDNGKTLCVDCHLNSGLHGGVDLLLQEK